MKKILKSIICVIGASLLFSACEQSVELIDEIDYTRVLTPTKFEAEVVPATGTDVVLTWQKIKNAESYELEVYEQKDDSKEVSAENTGTLVNMFSVAADEIPYTVYGLEVDKSFYARVRGVSSTIKASNWAYLEKTFSTSAVRSSLNPVVTARTQNSITIAWDAADDKTDLTSVLVEPVVLKDGDEAETRITLLPDDISTASRTVSGAGLIRIFSSSSRTRSAARQAQSGAFSRMASMVNRSMEMKNPNTPVDNKKNQRKNCLGSL